MAEHMSRFRDDEYWNDLEPMDAGERIGLETGRTAYDIKALHEKWPGFSDRVLKQIPVLDTGMPLQAGAIYLDLMQPENGPFKGLNNQQVEADAFLVAKEGVDYELWNVLIGEQEAYRMGRFAPDGQSEPVLF